MHVEHYADPAAFLAAAAPMAASNAPLFAFVHAWTDGVARSTPDRCFMAVVHDAEAAGFALQRDEGPVVLGACSEAAALAFADALAGACPDLDGVTGPEPACLAFCARWLASTGRAHRLRHRMRNHVLTRLSPPAAVPGAMRLALEGDRAWLCAQLRSFADEANVPMSDERVYRYVGERLAEGGYRVWETPAGSQAFAGFSIAGPNASRVAPVYTVPAARNQGYASALVAALCAELLAERPQVYLVTDLANPTSNALYRRLGFEPLDDSVTCEFVDPA